MGKIIVMDLIHYMCAMRLIRYMCALQVAPEGKYVPPPASNQKASYATMVYVRATIVEGAGWALARSVTIAVSTFHTCCISIVYTECCLALHDNRKGLGPCKQAMASAHTLQKLALARMAWTMHSG